MIVGFSLVMLICIGILMWQRNMRRSPGIQALSDTELRLAFAYTIRWSVVSGLCWGLSLAWLASWAITGSFPKLPAWLPPTAVFIPVMIGAACVTLAEHPRLRKMTGPGTGAGNSE